MTPEPQVVPAYKPLEQLLPASVALEPLVLAFRNRGPLVLAFVLLGQLLLGSVPLEPLVVLAYKPLEPLVVEPLANVNLKNLLVVRKNRSSSSPDRCKFPDRSTGAIWDYFEREIKVSPV